MLAVEQFCKGATSPWAVGREVKQLCIRVNRKDVGGWVEDGGHISHFTDPLRATVFLWVFFMDTSIRFCTAV